MPNSLASHQETMTWPPSGIVRARPGCQATNSNRLLRDASSLRRWRRNYRICRTSTNPPFCWASLSMRRTAIATEPGRQRAKWSSAPWFPRGASDGNSDPSHGSRDADSVSHAEETVPAIGDNVPNSTVHRRRSPNDSPAWGFENHLPDSETFNGRRPNSNPDIGELSGAFSRRLIVSSVARRREEPRAAA